MEDLKMVISNPIEGEFLKNIGWNKEEFMKIVSSITEQYEGLTYTEEQIKEAKADRAKLNSMKKEISDRRIQVKNLILEPYNNFEREVKEVVALIEKPVNMIDEQIKAYENSVKENKKKMLKEVYDNNIGEFSNVVTFERLMDISWLNQSVTLKKATKELTDKIETIADDVSNLNKLVEEDFLMAVQSKYFDTLDFSQALKEQAKLKEIREIEKQKEIDQKEEIKEEVEIKEPETKEPETKVEEPKNPIKETLQANATEKMYRASYLVAGTEKQLKGLIEYMNNNGIKFERITK